jgi:uncharacterized protein
MRIGVISDTHGMLRPAAIEALRGVEHILHAGDVGDPAILDVLRTLAPVTAIGGNIDVAGTCAYLPATEVIRFICCTTGMRSIWIRLLPGFRR